MTSSISRSWSALLIRPFSDWHRSRTRRRTSARTVSGGSVREVLHVQPLDELLVDADLELLEVNLPLGLRRGGGAVRRRRHAA